jgi:hypothetical protein
MEKIKLSLNDALSLEFELNGAVNPQTKEVIFNGLLAEKMSLKTKYWLTKLSDKLTSEKKTIEGLRDDLIKKYGKEEEGGNIFIKPYLDEEGKEINPDYTKFSEEMNELLLEEKEFDYNPIPLDDLADISTEGRYNLVFKLVKED